MDNLPLIKPEQRSDIELAITLRHPDENNALVDERDRMLKVEAIAKLSNEENPLPIHPQPRSETPDPRQLKLSVERLSTTLLCLTDNALPRLEIVKTEKKDPAVPILRTEYDEPKDKKSVIVKPTP
jgi:hypothetical protein